MEITNYKLGGEQKRNFAHFASIVKLALVDGILTEGEEKLLKRLAKRFHILEDRYNDILENPSKYPMFAPNKYEERIEHLYDLTKMVFADEDVSGEEAKILRKVCIGIGFPVDNAEKITDEAIHLVLNDNDLDDFTTAIKQVNRF
jgi:uncharacterized tellurite resistance protein B-like protein